MNDLIGDVLKSLARVANDFHIITERSAFVTVTDANAFDASLNYAMKQHGFRITATVQNGLRCLVRIHPSERV